MLLPRLQEEVMSDETFVQKVALSLSRIIDKTKVNPRKKFDKLYTYPLTLTQSHLLSSLYNEAILLFTSEVSDALEKQVFKSNFNQVALATSLTPY